MILDNKKMKNLIVFDIDGTLTDSVNIHHKAFKETIVDIGVKNGDQNLNLFKHHTDSFISKEIYETDTNKPFTDHIKKAFEAGLTDLICSQQIDEIIGAKKIIEDLLSTPNFGFCFATGSLRRPAEHKLKSIGIAYDNSQLVTSDNIFERENIVTTAIEKALIYYNVEEFERIISVGDGLWDLITAKNLGLEFIGIGKQNKEVLIKNGAELVYDDLSNFKIKDK